MGFGEVHKRSHRLSCKRAVRLITPGRLERGLSHRMSYDEYMFPSVRLLCIVVLRDNRCRRAGQVWLSHTRVTFPWAKGPGPDNVAFTWS